MTAGARSSRPSKEPAAWLLLGPEEGEKAAFVDKVRAGLGKGGEPPEVHRFYAGESPVADIVVSLRNLSLFSRHRLVIVASAEEIRRADDVGLLVDYLSAPASDATLILLSSGFAGDSRRKSPGAIPAEHQKIFWELFDNQKQGWVTSFFRQRSLTIEADAVDYLLDMVENNTRDMRVECERLAQFFGPGAALTLESVEQYVYHSKEENVFTLFDRICAGELTLAEEALDRILLSREAEATQLAAGLLMQFRRLAGYVRMRAANYEGSEAFQKLRIYSKRSQKTYLEGARRYSSEDLALIVRLLVEFDERFRSVKADLHDLLLRLLVYYLVARSGRGAWQLSLSAARPS